MAKTIVYFLFFILLISVVYAATENYRFLYNPFTAKRDRSVSSDQTDFNWTFGNLVLIGNITGVTFAWNRSGTNVFLANTGDNVGIGTSKPTSLLDVRGGNLTINSTRPILRLIDNDDASGTTALIEWYGNIGVRRAFVGFNLGSRTFTIDSGADSVGDLIINSGDDIFFRTNDGTDVLTIDESKVGIGDTTPSRELTVVGNVAFGDTSDGLLILKEVGLVSLVGSDIDDVGNNDIVIRASTVPGGLYINTAGKIGIGTTSPSSKLHIEFNTNAVEFLQLENSNSGNSVVPGIKVNNSDSSGFIEVRKEADGTTGRKDMFIVAAGQDSRGLLLSARKTNGNITFSTGNSADNVERMRLTGGGNLGIGLTNPHDSLEVIGNVRISGSLNASSINTTNFHVEKDALIEGKLDIGIPGTAGGLDIGEGGSYTKNHEGTTIVQAFTYDASAASGSRFTEFSNLDATNTWLADPGDRLLIGSQEIFWAVRFEISTAIGDSVLDTKYYDGNNLTSMDFMGILKNNATSVGIRILNQTVEKEYVTWDHEIQDNWTTADNIDDLIPNGASNMYWVAFEVPSAGITNAPVVTEIKVRGTDFDFVSGTSYPILWGNTRIENHERVALNVVKSPGGTTTTDIDIDSAHQQTVFDFNGAGDLLSFFWVIPEAIDTSSPIHVELDYAANAADTFDLDLSLSKLRNATVIGNSIAPDFTESTSLTSAAANTVYTGNIVAERISIRNMTSNNEISFELQRTDTANAMYPLSLTIHYISFSIGEIVTAE